MRLAPPLRRQTPREVSQGQAYDGRDPCPSSRECAGRVGKSKKPLPPIRLFAGDFHLRISHASVATGEGIVDPARRRRVLSRLSALTSALGCARDHILVMTNAGWATSHET